MEELTHPTPTETELLEEKHNHDQPIGSDADGIDVIAVAMNQALDLDTKELQKKYQNEVTSLIEWAKKKTNSSNQLVLRSEIRSLIDKVGTPSFGDKIKHLVRMAYLDNLE